MVSAKPIKEPDFILFCDGSGKMEYTNQALKDAVGYTEHEISKQSLASLIHSAYISDYKDILHNLYSGIDSKIVNFSLISKMGKALQVKGIVVCRRNENGKGYETDWFLWKDERRDTVIETNEAVLSAEHLIEKQKIFASALVLMEKPIEWNETIEKDKTLDHVFAHQYTKKANEPFLKLFLYTEDEVYTIPPHEMLLIPPDNRINFYCDLFDNGFLHLYPRSFLIKGKQIWLEGNFSCLYDNQNRIIALTATLWDYGSKSKYNSITNNEEQLTGKLTDQLPGALYQFLKYPDGESIFLYVSDGLKDIFEVTPKELMLNDRALAKRIHPDDVDRVNKSIDYSVQSLEIWDCDFRVVLPDKGLRWIRGLAQPEKVDDGGVVSQGYFEDITEKKEANDWLMYLNAALMNISESVVISDMNSRIIYANQKVKDLHGYEPEELVGKPVDMMNVDPVSKEQLHDMITALNEGRTYESVGLSRRKNGSTFLCEYSVTPLQGDTIEFATAVGVQRDITERTHMLEKLKKSNERFEQLTKHSRAIAWETDISGSFTYISDAVEIVLGYKPIDICVYRDILKLIIPSERGKLKKKLKTALEKKQSFSDYTCPIVSKSGDIVYLSVSAIPQFNEDKTFHSFRGLAVDITEKEKMQQQIVHEEERYRTTLLSVGEGIISTDQDGTIVIMNHRAENMTGWTNKEAAGKSLVQVFRVMDEQTGIMCKKLVEIVLENAKSYHPDYPKVLISKNGKEIPIEMTAAPIKNSSGEMAGAVIAFRDFSEYRERQKQIEYLSYNDYLTGLYNRRYFTKALERLNIRNNLPITVMSLDVNGLKLTNDAFGHKMGDVLLKTVADILKKACRKDDVIARLGGDEFAIILPRTDASEAEKLKQRILCIASKTKMDPVVISLAAGYAVKTTMSESMEKVLIDADNKMYKEKFNQGKTMRNQTIETVLRNINLKYDQEQIHTERVSQYCYSIASALNLSEKEKSEIRLAGLMHDIGKIVIPSELLNKPGNLSEKEIEVVKKHTETGYQILRSADEYVSIAKYVLHHHERWDGTGYPAGISGEEIPLPSRIIAVADAYEAMTASRPYQNKRSREEAKAELIKYSGTQFDPEIIKVFLESVLNEQQ